MSAHTTKNATSGKATWSFYGDDDTGIDSDAANQIDLMAGGTVYAKVNSSGLSVDTINEYTGANGVVIDGVTLKDGGVTLTGTLSQSSGSYRTPQAYYLSSVVSSIAGTTDAGGFFALSNPFGADVLIQSVIVNLGTAASSATATVDVGTAAASNTSADNLLDGLDLTTAGVLNNVDHQGTNGKMTQSWGSAAFITGTVATGDVSDAVASVYVTVIPV